VQGPGNTTVKEADHGNPDTERDHRLRAPVSSVRIGFNPHQVLEVSATSSATKVIERKAIGPKRDFTRVPAKHVALRELDSDHC
jgi:hypothetical protein